MRERPDMVSAQSPAGLRVFQLTESDEWINSHIYMESHVFTPDSRRFVYVRYPMRAETPEAHGQLMLCDLGEGGRHHLLSDEPGARAPAVDPTGTYMYYLASPTGPAGKELHLKRISLETFRRETLLVIDKPLGVERYRPSLVYGKSSISSDGRRLVGSAFLGDGETPGAPFGLLVFDLERADVHVIECGSAFCNTHPQYSRSTDPVHKHDILVQHNHGAKIDANGKRTRLTGGSGADIHVVRDDGTDWRTFPLGRDVKERCQGHQAWRGRMHSAVIATTFNGEGKYGVGEPDQEGDLRVRIGRPDERVAPLVEAVPMRVPADRIHDGYGIPGADEARNEICRTMIHPSFCHFAFDGSGTRFVSDTYGYGRERAKDDVRIYVGTLPDEPNSSLTVRYLMHPKSSFRKPQYTHPHPFLAPDTKSVFFNSDVDGTAQIWMATGFEYP